MCGERALCRAVVTHLGVRQARVDLVMVTLPTTLVPS